MPPTDWNTENNNKHYKKNFRKNNGCQYSTKGKYRWKAMQLQKSLEIKGLPFKVEVREASTKLILGKELYVTIYHSTGTTLVQANTKAKWLDGVISVVFCSKDHEGNSTRWEDTTPEPKPLSKSQIYEEDDEEITGDWGWSGTENIAEDWDGYYTNENKTISTVARVWSDGAPF